MSEPAAKQRQMIDLDEFERRLSRSPSAPRNDDPLAELARLVGGGEDRFESMFQTRPTRARAPEPHQAYEEPHHVPDWLVEESHQHAQPAHHPVDFAAIEAGLRGSLDPEFQNFADAEDRRWHDHRTSDRHQQHQQHQHDHYAHDDFAHDFHAHDQHVEEDYAEDANWLDAPVAAHAAHIADEPRSRMPLYATAAIIIAGMLGIGATFAMKRTPPAPAKIALITAPTTPVKVAVADAGTDASASDNASILDKTPQPAPTAAVSQTEQPVDVNAVATSATPVAAIAPAAAVPVPPPPGADVSSDSTLGDMVQPHKVKTIAVRPDGSFADSAAPPPPPGVAPAADPAMPSMTAPSMTASAGGAALTPAPAPQAPAAEPSRVPPASDDLPWSAQSGDNAAPAPAPAAPAPHASHHKPVQVARAETGADDAVETPAPASGGFSVQLAAPGSEAEAHAALTRLTRSYGAELHGYRLKYRQAKVGAKTVYRVRVSGLSHAAAISLCEKLKAKGAACFLAHG